MVLPRVCTPNQKGFTVTELLVVMAITLIVFSLASFAGMEVYRGYLFRSERDLAVSVLQKARSQALANVNQQPHGVHLDTTNKQYVLFEGSTYNAAAATNIAVPFLAPSISHSGMTDVVFNQLDGGITSVPAALHFSDVANHISDITFNNEGQITWTN
jgi:prepilin-type N-terminal cleavage/methylation domain-containing protein